jgi:fermentation-respiration switch protein FrsA (DUF1100 family)
MLWRRPSRGKRDFERNADSLFFSDQGSVMRPLMTTMLTGLLLLMGFLVLVWALQRRLMYFPMGPVGAPAEVGLADAEAVRFRTADGLTLYGWFLPSPHAPATYTVIVFNGNAGNRSYRAPLARALRAHGLAVLLFDYRGFGENEGTPTEAGLAADARAARAFVIGRPDVDPDRLVYFGESLGSGVAVDLAAEHTPAALLLRSPFASMADVGQLHYPFLPVRWFLRDRYAAIDRIEQVRCPLLVIAGDRDSIIPIAQSRRLYDAASSPKKLVVVQGADHNDLALLSGPETIAAIADFLPRVPTGTHDGR